MVLGDNYLSGFDGHLDTPVETLHVILLGVVKYLYRDLVQSLKDFQRIELQGCWAGFNSEGLNCPAIRPVTLVQFVGSLVGKEFRVVVEAAPFVFFRLLPLPQRHLWTILGHLCSYVFQTSITDKASYIKDIKILADCFLNHIISMNAQWTNKPKFHMLLHLAFSIEQFGPPPPPLCATQIFESYNGVMRKSSVHSNRQAPGRDIATSFNDERLISMLVSDSFFHDEVLNIVTQACSGVWKYFENPQIQKSLGWNANWNIPRVFGRKSQSSPAKLLQGHSGLWWFLKKFARLASQMVK